MFCFSFFLYIFYYSQFAKKIIPKEMRKKDTRMLYKLVNILWCLWMLYTSTYSIYSKESQAHTEKMGLSQSTPRTWIGYTKIFRRKNRQNIFRKEKLTDFIGIIGKWIVFLFLFFLYHSFSTFLVRFWCWCHVMNNITVDNTLHYFYLCVLLIYPISTRFLLLFSSYCLFRKMGKQIFNCRYLALDLHLVYTFPHMILHLMWRHTLTIDT